MEGDLEELGIEDRLVVAVHNVCLDTGLPRLQALSLGIVRSPSQHAARLACLTLAAIHIQLRLPTNKEDKDDALLERIRIRPKPHGNIDVCYVVLKCG